MKNSKIKYLVLALLIMSIGLICYSVYMLNKRDAPSESSTAQLPRVDSVLTDIKFDATTINLGDIGSETTVKVSYILQNVGDENLTIHFVKPDCSCTDFYLSKRLVTPGDTAKIELTVDTKGKIGAQTLNTSMLANTNTRMYKLVVKMNVLKNNQ